MRQEFIMENGNLSYHLTCWCSQKGKRNVRQRHKKEMRECDPLSQTTTLLVLELQASDAYRSTAPQESTRRVLVKDK